MKITILDKLEEKQIHVILSVFILFLIYIFFPNFNFQDKEQQKLELERKINEAKHVKDNQQIYENDLKILETKINELNEFLIEDKSEFISLVNEVANQNNVRIAYLDLEQNIKDDIPRNQQVTLIVSTNEYTKLKNFINNLLGANKTFTIDSVTIEKSKNINCLIQGKIYYKLTLPI
ncbi:MAG: hypothetical protein N2505_00490 [Endomicrobia bacterium]|nr:hypothetical protein [Endomicrobiia bacterium]